MPIIRVLHHSFSIRNAYAEGALISAALAHKLNLLRARALAGRARHEMLRRGGGPLSSQQLTSFEDWLAEADQEFLLEGQPDRLSGAATPSKAQFDKALREISFAAASAQARRVGQELSENQLRELAEALSARPDLQEQARQRVLAEQETAAEELDELICGSSDAGFADEDSL